MIYVVMIYDKGRVIKEFVIEGLDNAQKVYKHYEVLGFDVELEPDVMAYLRKYPPQGKKPALSA